jgi:hypothetical protein
MIRKVYAFRGLDNRLRSGFNYGSFVKKLKRYDCQRISS